MNSTTDEQIKDFQNLGHKVRKLAFPSDQVANRILSIYHPPCETNDKVDTVGPITQIETLKSLASKIIFKNYKGGPLHTNFQLGDLISFGENLDVTMKLEIVVGLESEIYWKRVAEYYCNDKIALLIARCARKFYWKPFGVECKFTNIIENMTPDNFIEEKFMPLAKSVSRFITNLNIKQMMPLRYPYLEKSIYNPKYKYMNYPCELCDHLNLGIILNQLTNLTSLSLQYGVLKCQYKYEKRFFEISYEDVQKFANGILALKSLKSFRFQHTRLDDEKLRILIKGLVTLLSLESLELLYCNLKDDSGKSLGYLLENNTSLKSLDLKGNEIKSMGCQAIGYGLQEHRGKLEFLGMSRCPIEAIGVLVLGGGFKGSNLCSKLDFSFCSVGTNGAMHIAEILSFHKHIVSYNIAGIPLGYSGGTRLIELIENCFQLIELECRSCDLTRGQESKLNNLIERNLYYKDHPFLLKSIFTEADEDENEDLLEMKRTIIVASVNKNSVRISDMNNLYANCELLRPRDEVYPDTLGDMTSFIVSDVPEEFLPDLDITPQTTQMKLVRANSKE